MRVEMTYIDIHEWCGLAEPDVHREELRITASLGLEFEATGAVRIVHSTNVPLNAVTADFVYGVETRNVGLVGLVWDSDGDILQRITAGELVLHSDVVHVA